MQYLFRIRRQIRAPRLPQRLDIEEPQRAEPLSNAIGRQFSLAEKICLVLTDMVGAELVRAAVEVSCEILHRRHIGAHSLPSVISTLQFFEHQLAKIGHNNLLDGGYSRSATTADKLAREASAVRLRSSRRHVN